MPDVTAPAFDRPDLTTFCRVDELGLEVTGQRVEPKRAVLACRVAALDDLVSPLRLPRRSPRHCGPTVGARTVGVETDRVRGHGPSLPLRRV